MNRKALIFASIVTISLAIYAYWEEGSGHLISMTIGLAAGVVLYNASFGFTAGWRNMVLNRRGRGLRAQMLLLGIVILVAYPVLATGSFMGQDVRGTILPLGLASAFGAFVFGVGMQLGSGCASGTLFTVGGGSTRMIVVLAFFIGGSVWATAHWDFWAALPRTNSGTSLIRTFGAPGAVAMMLGLFAAIWATSVWLEKSHHGNLERGHGNSVWSIWTGAVLLAAVTLAFLLITGRPWGITYGFAVWGAQAVDSLGADPLTWTYWSGWRSGHVEGGPLSSRTNASNVGIILGALIAACVAGRFAPKWQLSGRDLMTAIIGGLLMGYGARLAYGCNIGAYLGGLTSGSLHGVWWLIWGFAGSFLGTRLRVWLGVDTDPIARTGPARI
ncbi:YeeE/YedE family protein [Pontivivens insulae]|nr:YeeE/YedE family protein [Pontivivens insulae]